MKVEIVLGDEFKRQFKRLAKKYPSLKDDFITSPLYTIPLSLTGERDVSFRRYGVWCFISVII